MFSFFKSGLRAAYNVSENPTFVSEPWSIYPAKHKQNGRVVSVFIFDKTRFEAQINKLCGTSSNTKSPRVIIQECYELIKNEFNQLSKLKHPQILTIYETLEETKTKFLFVSEPVVNNLLTVDIKKQLDELSIQKGLLQISKGVQFLHNYCTIIHFNLQPSSIFINDQGDWKLGGFKFLQNLNEISPSERDNFYIMNNSSIVPFANLNLNFTAPELLIDSQSKLDFANDIWSFGCLIYYLYNNGDSLISCFDQDSISDYKKEFRKFESKFYNHRPTELKYVLKNVPEKLYPLFPRIMARYPHDRLTIDEFIDSDFFNGSVIKAMWFLDEFSTKTMDEKYIFLEGLPEVDSVTGKSLLSEFPPSFRSSKLLPLLIELVTNELNVLDPANLDPNVDQLMSFALNIIFTVGSSLSSLTFQDRIYTILLKDNHKNKKLPNLLDKLINASVKTRLTIITNLPVLESKLNDTQIVDFIKKIVDLVLTTNFPVEKSHQQDQIKLQESFLTHLEVVISKIEFPYIKNTLFPLICQIFKTTSILSTKLVTIQTFGMFVDQKIIDKIIVTEQLLPVLKNLKSRDKRIVGAVINFFVKLCASEHVALNIEAAVDSVLPQCYSLAFGCNDCSKNEFKQFIGLINNLQKVLTEKKLSTLSERASTPRGDDPKDFESLINTQTINDGNKESIIKAPQTKNIMQPKRVNSAEIQRGKPQPMNSPVQRTPSQRAPRPAQSNHQNDASKPIGYQAQNPNSQALRPNKPKQASSLTLKPTKPNTAAQSQLSFGAVNGASKTNSKLLETLNGTSFDKDDDEFEEFQHATNSSSTTNYNAPSLNWNTPKTPTIPQVGGGGSPMTPNKHLPSTPVNTTSPTAQNYPPGFNSAILTPNSSSMRTYTKGTDTSNVPAKKPATNTDLLDFL